jgi:FkbM family methyltransferase
VLDALGRDMYRLRELAFSAGDVAIDVGAHIGVVSTVLATLNPNSRIIACEPSSSNFAMLCANLEANGVATVTPMRVAVTGERGQQQLTWCASATASATVGLSDISRRTRERSGWTSESVACVTLDDVFAERAIDVLPRIGVVS